MKRTFSIIAILLSTLLIFESVMFSFGRELTSDEKAAFIVRDEWVEWVKSFTASLSELDKTATAKIYEDMDFYDMQYRFTEKYKKVPEYLDEDGKPTQKLKDMIKEKRKEINKNRAGGQATTAGIDWDTKYGATNWMSYIPNDRLITDINMAGSVQAGSNETNFTDVYCRHQNLTVEQQLNAGVRVIDVTIDAFSNLMTYKSDHTYELSSVFEYTFVDPIVTWAQNHPTEVVIIIFSCYENQASCFMTDIEGHIRDGKLIPITDTIPKLGDVRGKVLAMVKDMPNVEQVVDGTTYRYLNMSSTSGSQRFNNVDMYVEAHDGMTINDKQAQLDIAYNEVNARTVNTDTTKRGKSAVIYTTTNVAGTLTPQAAATTINATLSSREVPQGNLWGWVMMDYVTADLAKSINITNP